MKTLKFKLALINSTMDISQSELRGAAIYYERYEARLLAKKRHLITCLRTFKIKSWPVLLARLKSGEDLTRFTQDIDEKYNRIGSSIKQVCDELSEFRQNKLDLIRAKAASYAEQRSQDIESFSKELLANGWLLAEDCNIKGRIIFFAPLYYQINDHPNPPTFGGKQYIFYRPTLDIDYEWLATLRQKAQKVGLLIPLKDNF